MMPSCSALVISRAADPRCVEPLTEHREGVRVHRPDSGLAHRHRPDVASPRSADVTAALACMPALQNR